MSIETIYRCDKCKRKVESSFTELRRWVVKSSCRAEEFDLCYPCSDKLYKILEEFLDRK